MPTFVFLSGVVDGEVRTNEVGTPPKKVANFRISTNPGFYSVSAWEGLSSKVPSTGSHVLVTGRLNSRSYEKTVGGETVKIPVVEVVASTIETLGAAPAESDNLFGD